MLLASQVIFRTSWCAKHPGPAHRVCQAPSGSRQLPRLVDLPCSAVKVGRMRFLLGSQNCRMQTETFRNRKLVEIHIGATPCERSSAFGYNTCSRAMSSVHSCDDCQENDACTHGNGCHLSEYTLQRSVLRNHSRLLFFSKSKEGGIKVQLQKLE